MDKDTIEARKMMKELPFKEKMKNFWYYYRKHTIVAVLAAVVLAVGISQCAKKVDYDLDLAYYSSRLVEEGEVAAFEGVVEGQISDVTGDEIADAFVFSYYEDISQPIGDAYSPGSYSRIAMELASDEFKSYILDQTYMDYFSKLYSEKIQHSMLISDIPEVQDALKLREGENVYLVTVVLNNASLDDSDQLAEHENALKLQEYFEGQKAEQNK